MQDSGQNKTAILQQLTYKVLQHIFDTVFLYRSCTINF